MVAPGPLRDHRKCAGEPRLVVCFFGDGATFSAHPLLPLAKLRFVHGPTLGGRDGCCASWAAVAVCSPSRPLSPGRSGVGGMSRWLNGCLPLLSHRDLYALRSAERTSTAFEIPTLPDKIITPVTLLVGCAKLSAKPSATMSGPNATIGMVLVISPTTRITAVGHRRKLLEAIAALRAAAADIDTTVPRIRRPIAADAERRPGNLD
jgi:hypothetical protein